VEQGNSDLTDMLVFFFSDDFHPSPAVAHLSWETYRRVIISKEPFLITDGLQ
jgi:hypothetical protein